MRSKFDLDVLFLTCMLNLKEEKLKQYSTDKCDEHTVYVFSVYDEYKGYFISNNYQDVSDEILLQCKMLTTKKGSIIAIKGLCDYAIEEHNKTNGNIPFDAIKHQSLLTSDTQSKVLCKSRR